MIKIVELVREVLNQEKDARNSDHLLYYYVCGHILADKGKNINNANEVDFGRVFLAPNEYGLPQFETVSRARRKLQHDFPELAGNVKVSMQRSMNEDAFKEFATE